ncbi:MAG TPA: benzoate-CoA ligase family protein [Acidimicrobiia bacterium]|nr:benzoate-CoA ligase family protein [Acidimicrobiia bacterium]
MRVDARRRNISTFLDHQVEQGRGDHTAVICGDERVTYGGLLARACWAAAALRDIGVHREERILLLLDDTPAFPATFLGAIRIGAVPVPVNPLYKPSDFHYFLEDSYARVVVADAAFAEKAAEAIKGLDGVRVYEPADLLGDGDAGADGPAVMPAVATHEDDMAFWLYSSGSTGRPKGVVHRQADAAAICETYGASVLGLSDTDVTYSTTKLYHAYGIGNGIFFPYWAGSTTVLTPGRPSPDAIFAAVERHQPTAFFSVPTLYNALVNAEGAKNRDFSSVRICLSAAEPLPPEVFRRFENTWGLPILDGIGSTEMLHIYCSNTAEARKPGSSGRPVPGYELLIRGEDNQPAPPGEVGELLVKGDSALSGYWHHRDRTRRTLVGEYFATGDRYRCDEDGFYWYEGRADDMIKVGGLWVSPIEIENVLMEHEAVLEAGVVGVEVEGFMKIRAHIIARKAVAESESAALVAELQNLCKERLQRYAYPHIVRFEDELPKTMTGKIQRFVLRGRE